MVDLTSLNSITGAIGMDLITALQPYMSTLAREGQVVYDEFIQHFLNKDWARVDALMYARMTQDERDKLSAQVTANVRQAALDSIERATLTQEILLKVLIALCTSFIPALL